MHIGTKKSVRVLTFDMFEKDERVSAPAKMFFLKLLSEESKGYLKNHDTKALVELSRVSWSTCKYWIDQLRFVGWLKTEPTGHNSTSYTIIEVEFKIVSGPSSFLRCLNERVDEK